MGEGRDEGGGSFGDGVIVGALEGAENFEGFFGGEGEIIGCITVGGGLEGRPLEGA